MKAYMILDLQYGSTGKGLLAGYLAKKYQPDVVATAWGPNAGHTYIDENGRTFIHRMLANGVVSPSLRTVLIGPGSVIDLDVLYNEISSCGDLLDGKLIVIHPQACIVTAEHLEQEKRNVTIGSTMKGTGAAVIQRIIRDPSNMNTAATAIPKRWLEWVHNLGVDISISADRYRDEIVKARLIQIEGAQGFSLSIYHGQYPYTTSRDVTPHQVLADTAMPHGMDCEVYGTLRTYPIRVSNRKTDTETFSSGPCYPDQREMEWSELGMTPELTTVTKLPRRIFTFSFHQLEEAVFHCNPDRIFLNFVNYLPNEEEFLILSDQIENIVGPNSVNWVGAGPRHDDVYDQTGHNDIDTEAAAKIWPQGAQSNA